MFMECVFINHFFSNLICKRVIPLWLKQLAEEMIYFVSLFQNTYFLKSDVWKAWILIHSKMNKMLWYGVYNIGMINIQVTYANTQVS